MGILSDIKMNAIDARRQIEETTRALEKAARASRIQAPAAARPGRDSARQARREARGISGALAKLGNKIDQQGRADSFQKASRRLGL